MRGLSLTLGMAALVAGCGGAEAPPAPTAETHAAMLATLDGDYIWDCTLTAESGAAPWHFVLQRQEGPRRSVRLLQAGRAPSRPLEVKENGAARIYTLRDDTEMIIASDGEAWAEGPGGSMGKTHTTGRCDSGGQPA